ncbi:CDP-alcohol phosphatidyltransferase family protein [Thiothrix fructosivorans]|uniref:CDP-alcohol phosphatidyltransferase family protein n=1 Tax=Thiothrix fructosivorans TaxID=111770 RepID=A0A8B0SVL4_9GAMM|nr:CDP-alcohol phosphatidyltransferase family protein [Thiothrix fructosivorans]MBO0611424.1 CDP-alcohol phosphatidyltransferase family protein [Thiothrix fructosivorans]QTX13012.1 CDP-alcohol phosphatidyltransferase family protein [Thiothrix fructosivorans]
MNGLHVVKSLPLALTVLRAVLGPIVVLLALYYPSRPAFGFCLVAAFLSDIVDGILARRLGIATPNLRRLDSMADSVFYIGAAYAAWYLYPAAINERLFPLSILVLLELSRYMLDMVKFQREASYHMWSSKLWGICLFVGFSALLIFGVDNGLVSAAIYAGILADIEGLAISLVLREWKYDVPTLLHAIRLQALHDRG